MLPLMVVAIVAAALVASIASFPKITSTTVSIAIVAFFIYKRRTESIDRHRGWRVGHQGRDQMYYEEFAENRWKRIEIDGEMLTGKAHHVVYLSSIKFPDWAQSRTEEIISRIKSEFREPEYEYWGDNQGN